MTHEEQFEIVKISVNEALRRYWRDAPTDTRDVCLTLDIDEWESVIDEAVINAMQIEESCK